MSYTERERKILGYISGLPKKILKVHGYENVPDFILHDLCHEQCFNLVKAAYFVDNPDFDYCKGIAGFSRVECSLDHDIWQEPAAFSEHMKKCQFHQKVRMFESHSIRDSLDTVIEQVIKDFAFELPQHVVWNMKHDNHGVLIYEAGSHDESVSIQDYLGNSVHLFGFCPIY